MLAWRIERHGGPDVLKRVEMPKPLAGPMQVCVRVEAVGINHLDLWVRKGVPGHKFPLPLTPGSDIAGSIDGFGPGAAEALSQDGLREGSPVLLSPGVSCGRCEACLSGFDPICRHYNLLGETTDGGCADYIVVPVANIIARPPELSASQAAALPIPYLTAWTMLMRKAEIRPGDVILVHAGGSGVSIAAIQIARMIGATVITTVGSDDKIAKARSLGADYVIQYRKTPFREELKKILPPLGRKGCDIVVDHVGADTFAESMKSLAWGGKLVTCGATSGADVKVDLKQVFFKNISILGATMGSKADLLKIVELAARGKLSPLVDSEFPMEELPKACERLETRASFGKVIVRC